MALSAKINGVTYRCVDDYSIKEQSGAVSGTTINVLLGANPVPLILHQVQLYIDGSLFFTGLARSVGTPEYSSAYETQVFSLDVSSLETLLTMRLITKNFYYYTFTSWTAVLNWIFTNYIAEENITLGAISTTSETFDRKYEVKNKKVADVLNDIASAIGNASWKITADRKFYFLVSSDFPSVAVPSKLSKLKLDDSLGDLRTVQTIVGASSGVTATATNSTLKATIAARTGGSGKIEIVESDSDIHSDTKAATEAAARLTTYAETTKEITCLCHDLAASKIFNSWPISMTINGVTIAGDFVVVERTISHQVKSALNINVKLRNNNFFARYGYTLKSATVIGQAAAAVIEDQNSDNKLTPPEKKALLTEWETIIDEKPGLDAAGASYGLTSLVSAYDSAFQVFADYLNGGTAWGTGLPLWLDVESMTQTEDVDGGTFNGLKISYYNARTALTTAIRSGATTRLSVSPVQFARSRSDVITPESVSMSAADESGAAYAGRFTVELSHDGATYQAPVYTSASNESSYSYAVPTTMVVSGTTYYVVAARVRLYASGGTTSRLGETVCTVALDSSSSAIYWGALTAAPIGGYLAGDYYWDNNPVALGGGVIRTWNGSAWIVYEESAAGYSQALAVAITDMMVWAKAQGVTTLAAANAVFGSIAASTAFITELEAQTLKVKGTIKTGDGAADNARVAIIDETGTSQLAFAGTGHDDMSIVDDGAVDGAFTVKVTKGSDVASPAIGDIGPGGGKIFYIDLVNKFVLEAAPADIADSAWSNVADALAGTTPPGQPSVLTFIGAGLSNSNLIIGQSGHVSSAAKNCLDYSVNGKSDWYLPCLGELKQMRDRLASTSALRDENGFSYNIAYLSSNESTAVGCWGMAFRDDLNYTGLSKATSTKVRPIRTIDLHEYFQWREDSHTWSSDIEIVAGQQYTLTGYDIKISFASQIGHVTNDQWTFIQGSMIGLSIRDVAGVEYVHAEDGQLGVGAPQTVVAAGNITLGLLDNSVLVNTDAAVTITIPEGCAIGHEIKIMRTVSSANAITVARSGSESIEGAATFVTHGSWSAATLNLAEVVLKKVDATNWRFVGGIVTGYFGTSYLRTDRPDGSRTIEWASSVSYTTSSTSSGNGYYAGPINLTFPAGFVGSIKAVGYCVLVSGAQCSCQAYAPTTAGCSLYIAGLDSSNSAYPGVRVDGRWRT